MNRSRSNFLRSAAQLTSLTEDENYWYYKIEFAHSPNPVTGVVPKRHDIRNVRAYLLSLVSKHNLRHKTIAVSSSILSDPTLHNDYTHGRSTESVVTQFT